MALGIGNGGGRRDFVNVEIIPAMGFEEWGVVDCQKNVGVWQALRL